MKEIYLRNEWPHVHEHVEVIEHIAKWLKPERYLEIGVFQGKCLNKIQTHAKECYAVDVNFVRKNFDKNVFLFQMTSDAFFNTIPKDLKFDMVFIDGDHNKDQVYKDFMNVKDRIIDDGFVIFHDSYPINEAMLSPHLCENSWEAVRDIKAQFHAEWEILTLPFNPGLTLMKRMNLKKQILWK